MDLDDGWTIVSGDTDIEAGRVILKNVPSGLTRDGLKNMCEKYGTIIEIVRPADKNYAFVQFESAA